MEIFLKNREKIKTLRRIYPKNQENLRTAILGFNFTGSYKKECTSRVRRKPLQRNQGNTLSFWWPTCFSEWSPFFYRVINKTKLSITNFQKQIPWNTNESRSLNKTIFTYNTSWIFSFYLIIYLFIHYSFCRVYINNLKVWGTLTQLCHNERNFLGNMKFKQPPNFVSEFTV